MINFRVFFCQRSGDRDLARRALLCGTQRALRTDPGPQAGGAHGQALPRQNCPRFKIFHDR